MPDEHIDDQPISKGDLKLITYQLSEMKNEIQSLRRDLKSNGDTFMTRREFEDYKKVKAEEFESFKETEFKPFANTLSRINWVIIASLILTLLSLLLDTRHLSISGIGLKGFYGLFI